MEHNQKHFPSIALFDRGAPWHLFISIWCRSVWLHAQWLSSTTTLVQGYTIHFKPLTRMNEKTLPSCNIFKGLGLLLLFTNVLRLVSLANHTNNPSSKPKIGSLILLITTTFWRSTTVGARYCGGKHTLINNLDAWYQPTIPYQPHVGGLCHLPTRYSCRCNCVQPSPPLQQNLMIWLPSNAWLAYLNFDLKEWEWWRHGILSKTPFFNFTTKCGYCIALMNESAQNATWYGTRICSSTWSNTPSCFTNSAHEIAHPRQGSLYGRMVPKVGLDGNWNLCQPCPLVPLTTYNILSIHVQWWPSLRVFTAIFDCMPSDSTLTFGTTLPGDLMEDLEGLRIEEPLWWAKISIVEVILETLWDFLLWLLWCQTRGVTPP